MGNDVYKLHENVVPLKVRDWNMLEGYYLQESKRWDYIYIGKTCLWVYVCVCVCECINTVMYSRPYDSVNALINQV